MSQMRSFLDLFERKWFSVALLIPLVVGVIGAFFSSYFNVTTRNRIESLKISERVEVETLYLKKEIDDIREKISSIRNFSTIDLDKIEAAIKSLEQLENLPTDSTTAINKKLNQIELKIKEIDLEFDKFRNALNPTDPTKVLTVARLGDKFELIQTKQKTLELKLDEFKGETRKLIDRNYDQIDSQVDRIVSMLQWLGLILIPVVLNTIRDFLGGRKSKKETENSG